MNFDLLVSNPISFLKLYLSSDNFDLNDQGRAVGQLVTFAWAVYIVDWGIGRGALAWSLGIRPRTVIGLLGILLAPFLHGLRHKNGEPDNSHIVGNTVAFSILGLFIALQGANLFYFVTLAVTLISGFGIWLFGREGTVHAGASGVIYGYVGFLLVYGLVSSHPLAFMFGIAAFFLYGWAVVGILPSGPGISWEGHLFGFVGGIVVAYIVSYVKLSCC